MTVFDVNLYFFVNYFKKVIFFNLQFFTFQDNLNEICRDDFKKLYL